MIRRLPKNAPVWTDVGGLGWCLYDEVKRLKGEGGTEVLAEVEKELSELKIPENETMLRDCIARVLETGPWTIETLKPIQVAKVNFEEFLAARRQFTTEEWMDVLMQSIGFNPEMFSRRGKLLSLVRLIPYCERNYNLIELGPKGTGKSHIYAEFSPHGMLISGAEVSVAKLFVNNSSGKIGLVGYWDCVSFDEFAGKDKKVDKSLVDIMKNYMANRSFSRGIEQISLRKPRWSSWATPKSL